MTSVPVALGIALACASVTGAIGADVRGRGFGWRQPAAVLGNVAIVIGIVPAVTSIGDGAWDAPATPCRRCSAASSRSIRRRATTACCTSAIRGCCPCQHGVPRRNRVRRGPRGPLEFTDRWAPPETDADQIVIDALDRIADGRRCAPARCSRPPGSASSCSPRSTARESTVDDPVAVPAGLIEALSEQLDISATYGPPTIRVFAIGPGSRWPPN